MYNILGKRIKLLREEKEISQLDLAKLLNVNNSTLSQYEAGNRTPSDEIKMKIADYFGVSIDYLLGRTDTSSKLKVSSEEPASKNQPKSLEDYIKEAESLMLFGDIVDENDKQALLTAITIAYETAIKKNKNKEQQKKDNK